MSCVARVKNPLAGGNRKRSSPDGCLGGGGKIIGKIYHRDWGRRLESLRWPWYPYWGDIWNWQQSGYRNVLTTMKPFSNNNMVCVELADMRSQFSSLFKRLFLSFSCSEWREVITACYRTYCYYYMHRWEYFSTGELRQRGQKPCLQL